MPFLKEYTILDELGKGGFATVYKVRHNDYGYIRAVRVLNETIVNESSKTFQKFLHECKVLLRLGNGNHPNIVHIYQPRLLENKALVEMDYVEGMDLSRFLKQEGNFVATTEVVRMATQISSALAYCHEDIYLFCMDRDMDNLVDNPDDGSKVLLDDVTRKQLIAKYKVIHNDIHSGNIIRRVDGNYILLDFGLAINGDEVVHSSRHANGAPEFKAPEKWDDESVLTEQSDIYSFGVVLYQLLAGQVPFPFNTKSLNRTEAEYQLSKAHQSTPPPSIEMLRRECFEKTHEGLQYQKDYPDWLEEVILKCLRKKPEERFRNGKELYKYIIDHAGGDDEDFFKSEIKRLNDTVNEYASKTGDLQNENVVLQTQLSQVNDELSRTQNLLTEAVNRIGGLQKQLAKRRNLEKLLIVCLALLAVACAVLCLFFSQQAVEPPKEEVMEKMRVSIEQMEKKINDKDNEIARLKEVSRSSQDNSAEITRLNKTINEKDNLIKEKNKEIATLQKDALSNRSIAADVAKLKSSIAEKEKQVNDLQTNLKKEQEAVRTLKTQLAKVKNNSSGNASEMKNLKTIIEQKENEIATLNSKLNAANNNISSIQKQLDKATKEKSALNKELEKHYAKLNAANNNITNLQQQLDRANKEIAALNKELEKK